MWFSSSSFKLSLLYILNLFPSFMARTQVSNQYKTTDKTLENIYEMPDEAR
jgi:hypothetical protein